MTTAASFCTSCGAQLAAGARFCPSCGATVAPSAAVPSPAPAPPPPPMQAAPPPPPWSAPAQAIPVAPARSQSHWKRNLVIGVIAFLVLVIGGSLLLTSGPADAVDRHLSLLAQGDLQTAYAEMSPGFKGQVTYAQFAELIQRYPILRKNTASWTSRSVSGNEGIVEGTLTAPDGGRAKVEYHVSNADGTWRVMGFGVEPIK